MSSRRLGCFDGNLYLYGGGKRVRVPVGLIEEAFDHPSSNPYDSGVSRWDEFELFEADDGRLWVKHTKWEDVHLAGKRQREAPGWWASTDGGRRWTSVESAPGDAESVHRIDTR